LHIHSEYHHCAVKRPRISPRPNHIDLRCFGLHPTGPEQRNPGTVVAVNACGNCECVFANKACNACNCPLPCRCEN
jgi:hypothetical protein